MEADDNAKVDPVSGVLSERGWGDKPGWISSMTILTPYPSIDSSVVFSSYRTSPTEELRLVSSGSTHHEPKLTKCNFMRREHRENAY